MHWKRLTVLTLFAATALPVAGAGAQVKVQDQADTFLSERVAHQQKMDAKTARWWRGDMSDPGIVSATNPKPVPGGSPSASLGGPGNNNANPGNPLTQAPGTDNALSPDQVEPAFSFEEMFKATYGGQGAPADDGMNDTGASSNDAGFPAQPTANATPQGQIPTGPQNGGLSDSGMDILRRANLDGDGPAAPAPAPIATPNAADATDTEETGDPLQDLLNEDPAPPAEDNGGEMLDSRNPNPF